MPPRPAPRTGTRARATVTRAFLFSDLRGYTDFVESKGDAAAADLLRAYRDIVRAEIARHAGAEIKTEGDSFYVVFESPSAALECAVDIQRAAHMAPGAAIRIGMGLHAGETVPYDDQFVGGAVNVAARLASKAKAGEIIASDTLRGLVRTGVSYAMEDRGPLRLKGVSERVRAWSVEWRPPEATAPAPHVAAVDLPLLGHSPLTPAAPAPGQIVCPVVVGRDAEQARFAEHLRLAATGRGQTVVLAGEAGVGKSAFVRDAIAAATRDGFRVLYGVTLESDKGLPYAPFVGAVRSGFRGIARERLGRVLGQAAPDLAQLFPELGKAQRAEQASAVEHHRLSVAFLGLFTTFSRETPVLLVVEDLHWADEASLGLFHYLARELRDTRILLLGTYRSDEMHRRHPLLRVVANMQRERVASEIPLARLDKEQVRQLIQVTFQQTDPNIKITDEFRDVIYARAEGNPFFTEELLKSLVESGDLYFRPDTGWSRDKPIDQLRIPGSVREAVRERIDRVSPAAQVTLSTAAVIGLRSPFELLRAVRGVTEADLETQLRELIEQQLVVELGGDDDEYGFRHALTKEVVYDDLLVRERKRLHRTVADALIARDGSEPALVAHHLVTAGAGEAAIPHLLAAAERAFDAYAPREAAAHYEKVVELGIAEDRLGAVLEKLADTYYLFDFALARKAAEDAAAMYRERADRHGLSRMLRLASRSIWQQGDANRAAAFAQEAIDALDGLDDSPELGRATANLGILRMLARANDEASRLSERAIEIGRRFDDPWTIANALITKGTVLRTSDFHESDRLIHEGIELAKARDLSEVVLRGYNNLLVGSAGHLSLEELDRLLDEGLEYARRHGLEHPMLQVSRAFQGWIRGEWDAALAAAATVPEGSYWRRNTAILLAQIAFGRDGPARALALHGDIARRAAETREAQAFAWPVVFMAELHFHLGDDAGAAKWLGIYRDRVDQDAGALAVLVSGPVGIVQMLAAHLDEDWTGRFEAVRPADPVQARNLDIANEVTRAVLARDAGAAARGIMKQFEVMKERGAGTLPELPLAVARELLRRGATLVPEWRPVLDQARDFAERARATWYLAELAKLEAAIAG